jgi:hypothetical protein
VISHTTIWSEQNIAEREASICELVPPLGYGEIMLSSILEDSGVRCAPFPPTQNIDK